MVNVDTGMLTPAIIAIIGLPLAGFLLNGLFGKKLRSEPLSGMIGSASVGIPFAVAAVLFFEMLGATPEERARSVSLFTWIAAGKLSVQAAFKVDQLSILMTLIVTGVGFLIHVYSIGYMKGDPAFWRFFAYLNLFIFMMLNLILADNFLLMFLGWEGVGLCSFLLIGFWHEKKFDTGGYSPGTATTGDAAKKAFVVNRIGDFGFLVALFMIFSIFGSLTFDDVFAGASAVMRRGDPAMIWICLLLFLGATGKSAQIPLFIWLPDAMAGPTPVSALIHAATMVTAGVYMVARCSVLFALAPAALEVVAWTGIATALFAATMGLVQNDIKKILAYSTVSQLGYMFVGLGSGNFTSGIFHVMTHAFFKALLFLGAGAVIHAMHDEQDIQRYGSLGKAMPSTYRTFLVAALAIAGIPPLAGFFSKDEILSSAFHHGSVAIWLLGWLTAGLTAFYMFRLVTLTFHGAARWPHDQHPHDPPATMRYPLMVLALLSVAGGFAGVPHALGGGNGIESWLRPVFEKADLLIPQAAEVSAPVEYMLMALSVAIAAAGIWLARYLFLTRGDLLATMARKAAGIHTVLTRKYYVDEFYDATIITPAVKLSEGVLWKFFDIRVVDGLVNGTARLVAHFSGALRKVQAGVAQTYALAFVAGVLLLLLGILFLR